MANTLTNMPIIIDTDITSFRTSSGYANGIRPSKIVLTVGTGGASTAGTVNITSPNNSNQVLYPPLLVPAAQAANTMLYVDSPASTTRMNWADFAVTGVTATGTRLFIWYNS